MYKTRWSGGSIDYTTHRITIGLYDTVVGSSVTGYSNDADTNVVPSAMGNIEPKTFTIDGQDVSIIALLFTDTTRDYYYHYSHSPGQVYIIRLDTLRGLYHEWTKFSTWGQVWLTDRPLFPFTENGQTVPLYISQTPPPPFEWTDISA